MSTLPLVFACLIVLIGLLLLLRPDPVLETLARNAHRPFLQVLAVLLRLMLGLVLVQQASDSRFPLVIEILGWLAVAAAAILALMGPRRFRHLVSWVLSRLRHLAWAVGMLAIGLGGFLIYAFT